MILNGFFWLALTGALLDYALGTVATLLNLRGLQAPLPANLRDVYSDEADRQAREYARARMRLDLAESTLDLAVLLGFWLTGGFGWLDASIRAHRPGQIVPALLFFGVLGLGSAVIGLPGKIYATFGIERRFGFNRTTWQTFLLDHLKGLLLGGIILLPLAALVLLLIERLGPGCWWICWLIVTFFSLGLSYVAPRWIMPLFNRFSPLPEGELGQALRDYARKMNFQIADLSVIDGSKRSSKSNAFFTGFGKNKRIALFDTLIARHTIPELVAVLAHEVGHDRHRHLWKMLTLSILQSGGFFFLASRLLGSAAASGAFGFPLPTIHSGLLATVLVWKLPGLLLGIFMQSLSRRHEFEADRFAASSTGDAAPLVSALRKLSGDNLGNPVPHPYYVWLHYSHPPLATRLAALQKNPI